MVRDFHNTITGCLTDWLSWVDVETAAPIMQSRQGELGGSIRLAVTSFGRRWFPGNRLWAQLPPVSLVDNLTKLSQDKWVTGRRQREGRERGSDLTSLSVMFWWRMCIAASAGLSRSSQVDGKIVFGCICKQSTAVCVRVCVHVCVRVCVRFSVCCEIW